jgi:predicted solute-binding protein
MTSLVYQKTRENDRIVQEAGRLLGDGMQAHDDSPERVEWLLLEHQADVALTSPLLYGKRQSDIVLLPGACLLAGGATGDVFLHFRAGLHSIETLGYYDETNIDTMLAQVLLQEKYGMTPRLLRMSQTPVEALSTVDALLLEKGRHEEMASHAASLDLYDEWFDMTQLPFVRQVFLAWETAVTTAFASALEHAGNALDTGALRGLEHAMEHDWPSMETSSIPPHYRYRFTDDAGEALRTFFQLAFYHGLHRDIPDFRIWEESE